ncbi:MAG: hypothetical protein LQ351_001943 [Letrouitia transgressa]|nr:MAG: hypothetical protein LQ351_001943 [Letrouitia transgressa]
MPHVDPVPDLETLMQADDPDLKESYSLSRKWELDLPVEVYYISLLVNKFSIGKIGDGQGFSWLSLGLDSTPGEMTVAHHFTRNLAQAFFGHYLMLPEVIANSQVQYGKHLSMLNKELNYPDAIYNNYLLTSILTAVLYETIALTLPFGWMMHISALERIIEASDSHLCDVLADLNDIRSSNFSASQQRLALFPLLEKMVTLVQAVLDWRWDWESTYGSSAYLVPCDSSSCIPRDSDTREPLFPTLIYYNDTVLASTLARYNSTLAILLDVAQSVAGDNSFFTRLNREPPPDMPRPIRPSVLHLPTDYLSPYQAAQEVVRSVQYILSSETNISGPALWLIFSLNLTWKALPPDSELSEWIRKMTKQAAILGGFKIGNKFTSAMTGEKVTSSERWQRLWAGAPPVR